MHHVLDVSALESHEADRLQAWWAAWPGLQRVAVQALDRNDLLDPHTPLERWMGRQRGMPDAAALPLAAWALNDRTRPWALLTPLHLQLEAAQVSAAHPAQLALDPASSHALWDALAPLFPANEGWERAWLDPWTWAVSHPELALLTDPHLASWPRVVDRPLTPWLPQDRRLRRWTNEAQMLLHALHERAPAPGLPANSIWWWGLGTHAGEDWPEGVQAAPWPPCPAASAQTPSTAASTAPLPRLQTGDWLSLCGRNAWATWHLPARPGWRLRWPFGGAARKPSARTLLDALNADASLD